VSIILNVCYSILEIPGRLFDVGGVQCPTIWREDILFKCIELNYRYICDGLMFYKKS
jgi:hypothetical protein